MAWLSRACVRTHSGGERLRILIFLLGAALLAAGGVNLYWSIDLSGIERGTAYAVSGATLVGSGVVTIALGWIGGLLGELQTRLADAPAAAATAQKRGVEAIDRVAAQAQVALDAGDLAGETAPAADAGANWSGAPAPAAEAAPPAEAQPAPAPKAEPGSMTDSRQDDAGAADAAPAAPVPAPADEPAPRWNSPPRLFPNDDGPTPVKPRATEARLVGRYQANGIDYALYSDGSIETEQGGEKRRFNSLIDLKRFIAEG